MQRPLPAPDQRSTRDLLGVVAVLIILAVIIGGTWLVSDNKKVDHKVAEVPLQEPDTEKPNSAATIPNTLEEKWRGEAPSDDQQEAPAPIVTNGGVLTATNNTLIMRDASTGDQVWHYDRGLDLCAVSGNFERIFAIYRDPKGCGEVLSFDARSGQYAHSRSSLAPKDVAALNSNSFSGMVSPQRVELWRSDLVRSVEVGELPTPVVPGAQKYQDCRISSALTRKDLLAVKQECPGKDDHTDKKLVRLLKTKPERSDVPEELHEFFVPHGSELVTIGQDRAGIYAPQGADGQGDPQLIVVDRDGGVKHFPIAHMPVVGRAHHDRHDHGRTDGPELFVPDTADLTHFMTVWTGAGLTGFNPSTQKPVFDIPEARGTGAMLAEKLLVPTQVGIAIYNTESRRIERTIPVDRQGFNGPISLQIGGDLIVERRGSDVVVLAEPKS